MLQNVSLMWVILSRKSQVFSVIYEFEHFQERACTFWEKTSRTKFNVRTWYEVENSLNGSYGVRKKIVPRVIYLASARKRLVKSHILSGFEIDKSIFTGWKPIFTRWKQLYLFEIDKCIFTGWKRVFTQWKWTYLFHTQKKCETSRHVSEQMRGRYPMGQFFFRLHMTHLNYFQPHIMS